MLRLGFAVWALPALCAASAALGSPDHGNGFSAQVDALVEAQMREQKIPGVALAVLHKGVIVVAKGYGRADVENDVPVTTDTIFQSGSLGKMFTAVAVMTQVEQGKIRLEDSVTRYLPGAPNAWQPITVRQLLNHTSGISEYGADFDYRRDYTDDELLKIAYALPLDFQPGAQWHYSNTGYEMLGILVKKATGKSCADILGREVFKPLGMSTARAISEADIVPHRAAGYRLVDGELKNQEWVSPTMNSTADGSLYFSLNDMIAWSRGLERGAILSPASWKQIYTPARLNSGASVDYGFGWMIEEAGAHPRYHHGGAWQGFRTYYSRYLADDLAVILLTNSAITHLNTIVDGVAALWDPALVALPKSTLIRGARIVDGTGAPARSDSVRIEGDKIVAVGALTPRAAERVVDGSGQILAPGFIDTHSHHDGIFERADPYQPWIVPADARPVTSQGVTTIIVGQDGFSNIPVGQLFETMKRTPVSVNVGSYVGHNSIRTAVLGKDFKRTATPEEITRMQMLVREAMQDGAIGLSTGLEYDPGIYSSREEVVALAKEAARSGGRYISHIRSEDRFVWDALDEIVQIGQATGMPVQVSHMKLAMTDWWGQADRYLGVLNRARASGIDITGDVYPYEGWQSTLTVLFPKRDFTNRDSAEFALQHLAPADGLRLSSFSPDPTLVGKTVAQVAGQRGITPADALMQLIAESQTPNAEEGVIGASMRADDVAKLIAWPHSNISSDGTLADRHPRGTGSFTRVLRLYVREQHLLTLEQAIHKMTGAAAEHMGITDRGLIRPGMHADLVLFDPTQIADRATNEDPDAQSAGVMRVWVNGAVVLRLGGATGVHSGQPVRHAAGGPFHRRDRSLHTVCSERPRTQVVTGKSADNRCEPTGIY